jgi:hypothetical protein
VINPSKSLIENKTQTMKMNDVTEPSRTAVTMIRGAFMRGLKWYERYSWDYSSMTTYFGISRATVSGVPDF